MMFFHSLRPFTPSCPDCRTTGTQGSSIFLMFFIKAREQWSFCRRHSCRAHDVDLKQHWRVNYALCLIVPHSQAFRIVEFEHVPDSLLYCRLEKERLNEWQHIVSTKQRSFCEPPIAFWHWYLCSMSLHFSIPEMFLCLIHNWLNLGESVTWIWILLLKFAFYLKNYILF